MPKNGQAVMLKSL